jgi:hypothetical protein
MKRSLLTPSSLSALTDHALPTEVVEIISSFINPCHIKDLWCFANTCRYATALAIPLVCEWLGKNLPSLRESITQIFCGDIECATIHQFLTSCIKNVKKLQRHHLCKMLLILYLVITCVELMWDKGVYALCRLDDLYVSDNCHKEVGKCYWYDPTTSKSLPIMKVDGVLCNTTFMDRVGEVLGKDIFNTYVIRDEWAYYCMDDDWVVPQASYPIATLVINESPLFIPEMKKYRRMLWVYEGKVDTFDTAMYLHLNLPHIVHYLANDAHLVRKWSGYG